MLFIFEVHIVLDIYYYMLAKMEHGILQYIQLSTLWFS